MQISYFVRDRTTFIRQFFATASRPFLERMAAIETRAHPFDRANGDPESGEPPFLAEWLEAQHSLRFLGQSCLSMLSATLHLYFDHLDALYLRGPAAKSPSGNWLRGYAELLKTRKSLDLSSGPADIDLLEEVVVARNSTQHVESITQISASYRAADLKKYPNPTFVADSERELINRLSQGESALLLPTIDVTAESLERVLTNVNTLTEWVEAQLS